MAKAELLFVGTDSGLLQFANPGGIGRWLRAGHSLPGSDIVAIWVDPADPTTVLCSDGTHLYTSSDGAQHWGDPVELGIDAFSHSRTTPSRILARSDDDAILSHDSGAHWRRVGPATRIACSGEHLWVTTATQAHHSSDGGLTWQPDTPWRSITASSDGAHVLRVTTTPGQSEWLLNGTPIAPPAAPLAPVHALTLLAGKTTRLILSNGGVLSAYESDWHQIADAPTLHTIAPTPYHPDRLWGADRAGALWYSIDRGVTWECIKTGLGTINILVPARLV